MEKSIILLTQEEALIHEAKLLDSAHSKGLFKRHSFCIEIEPDFNRLPAFLVDPYIKIGNANLITLSEYVTRISLRNPQVIYHTNQPGIVITNEFKASLNAAMNYPSCYKEYHGTVLECINYHLANIAKQRNMEYVPVESVDFSTISNYEKNRKDGKIC